MSCSICLLNEANTATHPCLHSFCLDCIVEWQTKTGSCPLCRTKISDLSQPLGPFWISVSNGQINRIQKQRFLHYVHSTDLDIDQLDALFQTVKKSFKPPVPTKITAFVARELGFLMGDSFEDWIVDWCIAIFSTQAKYRDLVNSLHLLGSHASVFVAQVLTFVASKLSIDAFDQRAS